MRVIVAGCGRVGAALAGRLCADGHEVAVIDRDPKALARLGPTFSGTTVRGHAMSKSVLEAAGCDHADAFIAVTSSDSVNIVVAKAAREEYRVPTVISRIYEPRAAEIYRRLGVSAVSSTAWLANEIRALLLRPAGVSFGDGEVRLVAYQVPPRLDGRSVESVERPGEIAVVALVRSGSASVPAPPAQLKAGDIVHLSVAASAAAHALSTFAP